MSMHTQPEGIKKNLGLGKLSDFEQERMSEVSSGKKQVDIFTTVCLHLVRQQVIPELKKNIQKGVDFVKSQS